MQQLELFVMSDLPCECPTANHILTVYETIDCLNHVERIKNLIVDNGFQLSFNYFEALNKVNEVCTAWKPENAIYLGMRSQFHKRMKEVTLPLLNPYAY